MVNGILKVFLLILLAPYLWVYFGFKILKSKEQRNRNNILISAMSFILFIAMIGSSGNSNMSNGTNSSSNVADNTLKSQAESITTDVIETTVMETDIIEPTTTATAATTEIVISETTAVETTVPETTTHSSVVTETVVPETAAPEVTEQLVWITRTGSKYHSINNCGNTNPDNAYQMSLSDAQASGYEPCKRCYN